MQLMDEFLTAVKRRFGNTTLVQFEDMAYDNTSKLLNMYRSGAAHCEARADGMRGGISKAVAPMRRRIITARLL